MFVNCDTETSRRGSGPLRRDLGVHGLARGAAYSVEAGDSEGLPRVLEGLTLTLTLAKASRGFGSGMGAGVGAKVIAAGDGGDTEDRPVEDRGG